MNPKTSKSPAATVPMQIGDRPITYGVSIDIAFLTFADECGVGAEHLFTDVEAAIATRHDDARLALDADGTVRPDVWELDCGPCSVRYLVYAGRFEAIGYICNATGSLYEPS
jgi:hypothetical protein